MHKLYSQKKYAGVHAAKYRRIPAARCCAAATANRRLVAGFRSAKLAVLRGWPFFVSPRFGTADGRRCPAVVRSQTLLQDSLAAQDFRKDSTHTQLETGKTVRQSRYPSWIGWALLAVLLFVIGRGIRQGQRI